MHGATIKMVDFLLTRIRENSYLVIRVPQVLTAFMKLLYSAKTDRTAYPVLCSGHETTETSSDPPLRIL